MKFLVLHAVTQLLTEAKIVEYQNNLPELPELPDLTQHVKQAGRVLKNAGNWLRDMMPISDDEEESIGLRRLDGKRRKRGRVIGGVNVKSADEFPSYVSIRLHGTHVCGGTILTPERILTAAHCKVKKGFDVWIGGVKRDGSDKIQKVKVIAAVNHPSYNKRTNNNDITIVSVQPPIVLNDGTTMVTELGTAEEYQLVKKAAKSCRIVGHGKLVNGTTGATLQKSTLMVDGTIADCTDFIPEAEHCFITKGNGEIVQGCNGDSGGPLFCSVGRTWKQFGVASFVAGKGCNSGQTGWFQPFMYMDFIYPPNIIRILVYICLCLIFVIGSTTYAVSSGLLPISKLRACLQKFH